MDTPQALPASPERPDQGPGRLYWRSLEERLDTAEFRELLRREFPEDAASWTDPVTRRRFLQLMAASLGLAGLAGCTQAPREKILPYTRQPEGLVPGKAQYYATAMPLAGSAIGLLVESHEGRPTKVEGNPDHPASKGATDAFAQASILGLYDPDRSQAVRYKGDIRGWAEAQRTLRAAVGKLRERQGNGLWVLTEEVASPTLAALLDLLLAVDPETRWLQYEPACLGRAREGARLVFGEEVEVRYAFDKADVVLALDADFLGEGPGRLRYAGDFMARRSGQTHADAKKRMNRLYAVECTPSPTGMVADHRLALPASQIETFARLLARELKVAEVPETPDLAAPVPRWLAALRDDLDEHPGRSVVVAGDNQPAAVHALVQAINARLGNLNQTVLLSELRRTRSLQGLAGLRELTEQMRGGEVEFLLILGGNPVFTAPADLDFAEALDKVPLRVHLGLEQNETAQRCQWHVPEAHYLETWGDARADDGTASVLQPLIAPLYGGKSAPELLSALVSETGRGGYELVRDFWRKQWQRRRESAKDDFEAFWRRALHDGVIPEPAPPPPTATVRAGWAERAGLKAARAAPPA
jgi:molybdopterin-containing oxidoreductase family iron-sulfur binding subunit